MPTISRFFGIAIYVYHRDHGVAHFHARYGDEQVSVAIATLELLGGNMTPRPLGMVLEWARLHQQELLKVWEQAAAAQSSLDQIEPLR